MFYYWHIEKIMQNFLEENNLSDLDLNIKRGVMSNYVRGAMVYRHGTKTILYNGDRIEQLYRKHPYMTSDEFILLAFIHELGHYFHWHSEENELEELIVKEKEAGKRLNEVRYILEKGAWDYGKRYVPHGLEVKFDMMNEANLLQYKDKERYQKMLLDRQIEYYLSLPIEKTMSITKSSLNKIIKWNREYSVKTKKTEVVEELLSNLKSDQDQLFEQYSNEMIITVLKDKGEIRIVNQSRFYEESPVCYQLKA